MQGSRKGQDSVQVRRLRAFRDGELTEVGISNPMLVFEASRARFQPAQASRAGDRKRVYLPK